MGATTHQTVTLTVDDGAGGAGPVYAGSEHRRLDSIHYVKPGSGGYTGTPLLTVTDVVTAEVLVNAVDISAGSRVFRPRLPTHDTAGAANAADFSAPAIDGRLQFDLSGAVTDGETGTLIVLYGGSK